MSIHCSAAGAEILIRPIAESDSIIEMTGLLHRSYKVLADMGFRYFASHQTPEQTEDRIRSGECFVGTSNGAIVATVTFYAPPCKSRALWYERPDVGHFGQFAVEPALQRSGIGSRLMDHVETIARERGLAELACDTAEGAAHLVSYYSGRGYRFIDHVQWDVTNYRSVVMSKRLGEAGSGSDATL
jgi:ribosomal protein S18 acetylase RimI-like enzyme